MNITLNSLKTTLVLTILLLTGTFSLRAQTVSTFGWNDYANWSGTLGNGSTGSGIGAPITGHYNPALGDVTILGPTVTTTLSAVNGPLATAAPQNYVSPGSSTGLFNPSATDRLEWGDNASNTSGSGLWHSSTIGFSSLLTMTGSQFATFNGPTIDFGGFLITNSGDTRTIGLSLTGGGIFSGVNFLDGYSDTYNVTGLGTSSLTLTWTGSLSGVAVYNPVISGSFDGLTISQSDMNAAQSTSEPQVYYRADSASIAPVPEPSGAILLAFIGIVTSMRRRR